MCYMRGKKYDFKLEMEEIRHVSASEVQSGSKARDTLRILRQRDVLKPFSLLVLLFIFHVSERDWISNDKAIMGPISHLQAMSGAETVCYYSLDIFSQADVAVSEYLMAVLLQCSFTTALIICTVIMKRVDRRPHYIGSALSLSLCHFLLAICIFSVDKTGGHLQSAMKYLQPVLVILIGFSFSIGIGPMVFTLAGELFPARAKGICSSTAMAVR